MEKLILKLEMYLLVGYGCLHQANARYSNVTLTVQTEYDSVDLINEKYEPVSQLKEDNTFQTTESRKKREGLKYFAPCFDSQQYEWQKMKTDYYYLKVECNQKVSMEEARDVCIRRGGHLAVIRFQDQVDAINELFADEFKKFKNCGWCGAWIGLKQEGGDYSEWMNKQKVTLTNWASGQPTGGPETCVGIMFANNGKWNDYGPDSNEIKHIVCERPVPNICVPGETVKYKPYLYRASTCEHPISYNDANQACFDVGAILAHSLDDGGRSDFLEDYIGSMYEICEIKDYMNCSFWIGAISYYAGDLLQWDAYGTRHPVTYTDWVYYNKTDYYPQGLIIVLERDHETGIIKESWMVTYADSQHVYNFICATHVTSTSVKNFITDTESTGNPSVDYSPFYKDHYKVSCDSLQSTRLNDVTFILSIEECAAACFKEFHCLHFVMHYPDGVLDKYNGRFNQGNCSLIPPSGYGYKSVRSEGSDCVKYPPVVEKGSRVLRYFMIFAFACGKQHIEKQFPVIPAGTPADCATLCLYTANCTAFIMETDPKKFGCLWLHHGDFHRFCPYPGESESGPISLETAITYVLITMDEFMVLQKDFDKKIGDCPGHDIGMEFVVTIDRCAIICQNSEECGGFVYRFIPKPNEGYCVPKQTGMDKWCRYPVNEKGNTKAFSYYKKLKNERNCPICDACDYNVEMLTCGRIHRLRGVSSIRMYQNPCFFECTACEDSDERNPIVSFNIVELVLCGTRSPVTFDTDIEVVAYTGCYEVCAACNRGFEYHNEKTDKTGWFDVFACGKYCQKHSTHDVDCFDENFHTYNTRA